MSRVPRKVRRVESGRVREVPPDDLTWQQLDLARGLVEKTGGKLRVLGGLSGGGLTIPLLTLREPPPVVDAGELAALAEAEEDGRFDRETAAHLRMLRDDELWDAAFAPLDNDEDDRPDPEEPTDAAPGSAEKLEVFARRFEARKSLFHPQDGRGPRRRRDVNGPRRAGQRLTEEERERRARRAREKLLGATTTVAVPASTLITRAGLWVRARVSVIVRELAAEGLLARVVREDGVTTYRLPR